MPALLPSMATSRWRLPLLGLGIVLIVVAPFLLLRQAAQQTDAAAALVSHTREVEALLHSAAADMRNLEAGALALASNIDHPVVRSRIAESRARIGPTLENVQRMTMDNSGQVIRIAEMRTRVGLRVAQAEVVIAAGATATPADTAALVTRYPVQPLMDAIIGEERLLLAERTGQADRARRRADALVWSAMVAQLLLLGSVTYFSTRQLTQRLEAERMALHASARAGAVLDTVREPIVLVDRDLRVVMHNVAFGEVYGVQGDVRGTSLADIGNGAWRDQETLRRLGDVLSRGRELWDHTQVQHTEDGADRTMLVNARRMALPDTDQDVALVTTSDVSAQKAGEERIRELNRQMEGKMAQVSDVNRELEAFSYSVSHDLRAPLRHIAGFSDKLRRHLGDAADDKALHYLEVIGGSARRMSALIDDLLVYSRLGRSALRLQAVDMQSLVEETRAMLEANNHADMPGHRLAWQVQPLPIVVADENMMRQVWLNLLGNAVKYSANSDPAEIEVLHRYDPDGQHHFSVRDNGAGFDMAYAGKLFGVFQRLHGASEFAGTGIGLASVRRVLSRHNGRIWAEAEPGKGATFHFVLPTNTDTTPAVRESLT